MSARAWLLRRVDRNCNTAYRAADRVSDAPGRERLAERARRRRAHIAAECLRVQQSAWWPRRDSYPGQYAAFMRALRQHARRTIP